MIKTIYAGTLIIGAGPAGLYAADELLKAGESVMMIDKGVPIGDRWCPETHNCDCQSCFVLEGEGGAGGFSDGKLPLSLLRGTQMERIFPESANGILTEIDESVVRFAGPGRWYEPGGGEPDGFYGSRFDFQSYPLRHVGSDGVRRWSDGMVRDLVDRGLELRTSTAATGFTVEGGRIKATQIRGQMSFPEEVQADRVIIASGIQGAPWLERQLTMLGIPLGSGPAGIGIRVETHDEPLEEVFERFYDWKLVMNAGTDEDPLYLRSFCCNRKGAVINQLHQGLGVRNVNGHASIDPSTWTQSSNFAVIAKIEESHSPNPQEYVRAVAQQINAVSGGHTIAQRLSDFRNHIGTPSEVLPSCRTNPMARAGGDIYGAMPPDLGDAFADFLEELTTCIPELDPRQMIVYAPEVKYFGKRARVNLETWQSLDLDNAYILGDATGYLDSFITAALTGVIAGRHATSQVAVG